VQEAVPIPRNYSLNQIGTLDVSSVHNSNSNTPGPAEELSLKEETTDGIITPIPTAQPVPSIDSMKLLSKKAHWGGAEEGFGCQETCSERERKGY